MVNVVPLGFEHLRQVLDLGYRVFDVTAKPYTSWSLTAVAEHLDTRDSSCWVALEDEKVVGFVLGSMEFELRDDWAYLEWIGVDPDHQGKGIARRLVDICCEKLFEAGASRVVTDVESSNTASATLMGRSGFAPAVTVTLFVRPNPAHPTSEQAKVALPKRPLIRSGRLVGDNRTS
ncbi:MAG TPA: GNAT family N-acetyltransferase [Micromonosporaceae bacterium]|nr:GNAT family N-acetyltransferase [Micromonosporaceae bacterium]HCU50576.1 GNAT family N-acetyltransferase [Micromonosporaceae bacterium]